MTARFAAKAARAKPTTTSGASFKLCSTCCQASLCLVELQRNSTGATPSVGDNAASSSAFQISSPSVNQAGRIRSVSASRSVMSGTWVDEGVEIIFHTQETPAEAVVLA
jgi:hypothetical protein